MKIYYFSYTRFPSEKAHALYLAKVAESFADVKDLLFTVVVPKRLQSSKESAQFFYNLESAIQTKKLISLDLFLIPVLNRIAIYVGLLSFSISSFLFALFSTDKKSVFVTNNMFVGLVLLYTKRKVIYELHDYPAGSKSLYQKLFQRVFLIQTNNHQKKILLEQEFKVPANKIYAEHNGVTIADFDVSLSKDKVRKLLKLNPRSKLVVYTGHLYDWKGVDTLAESASKLPNINIIFVGGTEKDVYHMKQKFGQFENVSFVGFKQHKEIPLYQRAADVLVLPNTAKKEISRLHTSPMKVFEYMASRTPIVASNIPSIREVLNDTNAVLVDPDNVESLAKGIKTVLSLSDEERSILTDKAFSDVREYTWSKRAARVEAVLKKTINS